MILTGSLESIIRAEWANDCVIGGDLLLLLLRTESTLAEIKVAKICRYCNYLCENSNRLLILIIKRVTSRFEGGWITANRGCLLSP